MFIDPAALGDWIDGNLNIGASLSAMNEDEAGTSAGLAGFPPDKSAQKLLRGSRIESGLRKFESMHGAPVRPSRILKDVLRCHVFGGVGGAGC
ncbi:hypothetical protein [Ensifer canadensis]